MNDQLTSLERRVLESALSGDASWLASLRLQVPRLRVRAREYTGVGFHTQFVCDGCCAATGIPYGTPQASPVVWANHPDVAGGAEGGICFSVFVKQGLMDRLEGRL
jgi:hypothetical protein